MDEKLLAFLRGLAGFAQNTRLNISLEGWPGAIAVWAFSGAVIGVAAILASSAKAEGDQAPGQGEPPEEGQQDNGDAPAEGSSDEEDDPSAD